GRSDLNDALKEGGRSEAAIGVGTRRLLIVCEVAMSLVLLMGAGVMVQSLLALRQVDSGFDPNNVLTMRVRLVDARYPTAAHRSAFFAGALQRPRALPGVEASGTVPRRSARRWPCRSDRSLPATCARWGFRCCADATLSTATRKRCSSVKRPRSCSGEQTIRLDAGQHCPQ